MKRLLAVLWWVVFSIPVACALVFTIVNFKTEPLLYLMSAVTALIGMAGWRKEERRADKWMSRSIQQDIDRHKDESW